MTSKERMMTALHGKIPDRLPITIHQWQTYHLQHYMNGMDQLDAFLATGLDASVTPWDIYSEKPSPDWKCSVEEFPPQKKRTSRRYRVQTPKGELTWVMATDEITTFHTDHPIKNQRDAEIFAKYWPSWHLNLKKLSAWYDRTGDAGIVRGFTTAFCQPGVWQDFCELVGTQEAIFWAMDEPEFVHWFLKQLTQRRLDYIHEEMPGAKFDLIEHGGGAASSTVISPAMFDEFCVPYDRQVITALHDIGLPVVYHTCGGMMANLTHIPANGCDASETLSPPGMGGDIHVKDRMTVKQVLGSKVALIGGVDQGRTLTEGTPEEVVAEVRGCFETFGVNGGYICSASDHFFHAPVENLKAMVRTAADCRYS